MKKKETKVFNLRMPEPLRRKVEKQAKTEKRSLNQQIVYLLETAVQTETAKAF